jgi:hypothetical protein
MWRLGWPPEIMGTQEAVMNCRDYQSEQHSRHTCSASRFLALNLVLFLGIGGFNLISTSSVWADQTGTAQIDSSNAGQITAVGSSYLEVEQRNYRLDPKLEIRTEGGQPMELTQLQAGMGVRLQLKEGVVSRIMVLNPR